MCRVAHFFHISLLFFFPQHFLDHFYREGKNILKKRRFCGLPTGHYYGHPLDRNQTFFKGGLINEMHVPINGKKQEEQLTNELYGLGEPGEEVRVGAVGHGDGLVAEVVGHVVVLD